MDLNISRDKMIEEIKRLGQEKGVTKEKWFKEKKICENYLKFLFEQSDKDFLNYTLYLGQFADEDVMRGRDALNYEAARQRNCKIFIDSKGRLTCQSENEVVGEDEEENLTNIEDFYYKD